MATQVVGICVDNFSMDRDQDDYYAVLHVDPGAPLEIIRASYRTSMQRLRAHPDLGGDHESAARLNTAYSVLKDPAKRAAYDATRKAMHEHGVRETAPSASSGIRRSASDQTNTQAFNHRYPSSSGIDWLGSTASWAHRDGSDAVMADPCVFCGLTIRSESKSNRACRRCHSPLALVPANPIGTQTERTVHRIGKNERLVYFEQWQDRAGVNAIYKDVSLTGLRFRSPKPLELSVLIRIESDICAAVARVAYCSRAESSEDWQIGAQFLTVQFKKKRGSLVSVPA